MEKNKLNQECIYKIFSIYNILLRNLEKIFQPYKLSASQFNILMTIKHQAPQEGISQVDIGKQLLVCTANITKITDKLLNQEYITRKTNPKDRRYNLLKITDKGSNLLDEIWKVYIKEVERLTQSLEQNEKELLIDLLTKWNQGLIN